MNDKELMELEVIPISDNKCRLLLNGMELKKVTSFELSKDATIFPDTFMLNVGINVRLKNELEETAEEIEEEHEESKQENKTLKEELAQVRVNYRLLFITLLVVTVINSVSIILRIIR